MDDSDAESDEIKEVTVHALVREVSQSGNHAFLIGAGTSRPEPAGIPTGGELIKKWQRTCYSDHDPDITRDAWIKQQEKTMSKEDSQYGYWFERLHPSKAGRRDYIQQLVDDAKPTAGHVILAAMMRNDDGGQTLVPVTLTPNFDDLLLDSFYLYLEEHPQIINHGGLTSAFDLTREDPAIVKLHGDYLYDNLRNVDNETNTLTRGMEEVLQETVSSHGLVVVGYSGRDESILSALKNAEEYSGHGIYWCVHAPEDEKPIKKLSPEVRSFLEETHSRVVPINGFVSLMFKLGNKIDSVKIPLKNEMIDRTRDRADELLSEVAEHAAKKFLSTNDNMDSSVDIFTSLLKNMEKSEVKEFAAYLSIELLNIWVEDLTLEQIIDYLDIDSSKSTDKEIAQAVQLTQKMISNYDIISNLNNSDTEATDILVKEIEKIQKLDAESENLENELDKIDFDFKKFDAGEKINRG